MTTATKNGAVNGATAQALALPVDSFKDAAPWLRRPFTEHAVKFKVQTTWASGGLIVAYIDARLVVERLNLVCPHLWYDEYQGIEGGRLMCKLTVDGISRRDIGDGYQGKGLYSDALKRAAVKFGVGVSLYAVPSTMLNISDGHLKAKQRQGKDTAELTPNGIARCKDLYAAWLATVGIQSFGEPLDHGDVEDSTGDFEADENVGAPQAAVAPVAPEDKPLTDAGRKKIADAIDASGQDRAMVLAAAGFSDIAEVATVGASLKVRAELDALVKGSS